MMSGKKIACLLCYLASEHKLKTLILTERCEGLYIYIMIFGVVGDVCLFFFLMKEIVNLLLHALEDVGI